MSFFSSPEGNALVDTVRRAGDQLLRYWPGGERKDQAVVSEKADGSLVSTADVESNEILTQSLCQLFPRELIFSEEVAHDSEAVAAAERVWIIDPLDGTSAFLAGRDDFSILVGRCDHKHPTVGLMFFPARGILALASPEDGVRSNGSPISVSPSSQCPAGRVYCRNFEPLRAEVASPMMDSGLALYKVACGELDGAIIFMKTHREWDIAAPMALIQEAGGRVSDECGQSIPVGVGKIAFKYLVASNGLVHQELLALIPPA